ncbi:endoribonuclease Dicer isoform X2 [Cimex lectularius]|uniref:Dicer-2 n=1 Tax=Cimex lectularius TaxID=79782 RepID=A0A8I6RUA7_CIMLE|nr:endoribonuclease Dicer isoform X2 [Cimex lectularius]
MVTEEVGLDFEPREYQVEILEKALKENTIVYMPTGSGKTFIAAMLIKYKGEKVEKKYTEGGQRIFFLVNTIPLVNQQASAIRKHVSFVVGEYSGDMNVDYWNQQTWEDQLDRHQVLVMTAQIFLDLILHGYIKFSSVAVLILDECHHATNNHCMSQIMSQYKQCADDEQPLILGLTATLLNANCKGNNLDQQILQLEELLCSKIITSENKKMVEKFSANPIEYVVKYSNFIPERKWSEEISNLIKYIASHLRAAYFNSDPVSIGTYDGGQELKNKPKWEKKICLLLANISEAYETLGLYAASKAALIVIVRLERIALSKIDEILVAIIKATNTQLHLFRKKIATLLNEYHQDSQPLMFCSDKMTQLFKIMQSIRKEECTIVFVEKRITAQLLFYIFEDLQKYNENFKNIKSDFIVGFNSTPLNNTRELLLEKKSNLETLKRFSSHITNVLFASDVIEEGIDIPLCNKVIKFDVPKTYRSYIQSKGRARHCKSEYILLVENDDNRFIKMYPQFKIIENTIFTILGFKNNISIDDLEVENIESFEPFGPTGSKVTAFSAISLVNRYCHLLPQDKFSLLTASWWCKQYYSKENESNMFIVSVKLPINSPIKEVMESGPFRTKVNAKRDVAVKVCKRLYELGELNQNLLPYGSKTELLNDERLFPRWIEENAEQYRSGSNKCKRIYTQRFPSWMCECKPMVDTDLYIHLFEISPDYECPNVPRERVFHEILKKNNQFAIICTKKWPKLCRFDLFMNVGKIKVNVKVNERKIRLTQKQIDDLFHFHCLLFTNVVALVKPFVVKDFENYENSFFIIPMVPGPDDLMDIDWDTIHQHKSIPEIKPVPSENRIGFKFSTQDYLGKVVVPWYRPKGYTTRYIVTQVYEDKTPKSSFPSEIYDSYTQYFDSRYNLTIENLEQPLIEVRVISSKMNCIIPRGESNSSKKRRKGEKVLEEVLVPELCTLLDFPSVYMLKATLIPSIVHRIQHILISEELRQKIAAEIQLGPILLPDDVTWAPLEVDQLAIREEDDSLQSTIEVSDELTSKMKLLTMHNYPWKKEDEPRNIEKHLSEIDLISVIHYQKFVDMAIQYEDSENKMQLINSNNLKEPEVEAELSVEEPSISIFNESNDLSIGPQLSELLQVLTSKSGCDIINYERLETLGDSFLKFIVSLSLFTYFKLDEGKLTQVKGKIVGNRNLFYCGNHINLGSLMKVYDFSPSDWEVPCFTLERVLKNLMKEKHNISANVLHHIELTEQERDTGLLSNETLENFHKIITENKDQDSASSSVPLLGLQAVSDKMIADCIEALIGVYLKSCGILGALKLCNWLGILALEISDIKQILIDPAPSANVNEIEHISRYIIEADKLEKKLKYKFKDRSFLLQALTHSSYTQSVTECYQRLEFLGDAILDFLITIHIYEKCGNLSPGELTDLRSALVNNVTFACLIVRQGIHLHMNFLSCELSEIINRFVEHQENRGHKIGAEVLFLIEENDVKVAEIVDVPKVLGDILESLIAAVYLDSGKCLKTTWRVIYNLMKNEIEEFSKNVPKNHIRVLYEKFPNPTPKFGKAEQIEFGNVQGILIPLFVASSDRESKIFHGIGKNKAQAKLAAAKVALRYYHSASES